MVYRPSLTLTGHLMDASTPNFSTPSLAFRKVTKIYEDSSAGRFALRDVSFEVPRGQRLAIVGRSGSGKSTLLHLAAGIDVPTRGDVLVQGRDLASLSERARTLMRRNQVGLVFQFFYLLPHLSVRENIALPELIAGNDLNDLSARVLELLERAELLDRAGENVQKLSGGEMQRVAICRALLRRPELLLADEPTGNLDDTTGQVVMDMMLRMASEQQSTLIYVTHSPELARLADEVWTLHSGILETS